MADGVPLLHLLATAAQIIFKEWHLIFKSSTDPDKEIWVLHIRDKDDPADGEARIVYREDGVVKQSFVWYDDSLCVNVPLHHSDLIEWYKDIKELEGHVGDMLSKDWYLCDQDRADLQEDIHLKNLLLHNTVSNNEESK